MVIFERRPTLCFGALICAAVVLRIFIAIYSLGSNDVGTWYRFASSIDQEGLWQLYGVDSEFNHPPFGALLVWLIYKIHTATGLAFPLLLRVPGILGDLITLCIVGFTKRLPVEANRTAFLLLYGFAPVPILLSGYHGNLDPLVVALSFLAVWVISLSERVFLGGVLLGFAASIKLPPLVLIPVVIAATARGKWLLFLLGLTLPLISVAVGIVWGGGPFLTNVLHYQPPLDMWGITAFLTAALNPWSSVIPGFPHVIATAYSYPAKALILTVPVLVLVALRSTDIIFGYLLAFGAFLIFAPGFGPQYLIYPLPALLLLNPRWGVRYLTAGSCALFALYSWFFVGYPFASVHNSTAPVHVTFLYYLTWCAITGGVGFTISDRLVGRKRV